MDATTDPPTPPAAASAPGVRNDGGTDGLTEAVVGSFAGASSPRHRAVLASLTRHLHAFVQEVGLTQAEWEQAIGFLTAVGQKCDDTRQEFILLSDVLGVSMLVESVNNRRSQEATQATVLGPFHLTESPPRAIGDTIDLVGRGVPCVVRGRVTSTDGAPLPAARVDVWQADDVGYYDVQQPGEQPAGNGRGVFTADVDGRFWFRTVCPSHYPIPTDGPVGELLTSTGRHPYRPAHIHFLAEAADHLPITTHVFVAGSRYLDSDAVFAVRADLVREFVEIDDPDEARQYGVDGPFRRVDVELVLEPGAR